MHIGKRCAKQTNFIPSVNLRKKKLGIKTQQETEDCLIDNYSEHPTSSYVLAFHGREFEEVRIP